MKQIQLTQGQVALVDDEDFDFLNQWKWHAAKRPHTFYAVRESGMVGGNRDKVLMHVLILGVKGGDHIDHNGLNNSRGNLRCATASQNGANRSSRKHASSKYLGVDWDKRYNKWRAKIQKDGTSKYLGRFITESEAAIAYNRAAETIHGAFANLNKVQVCAI